MSSKPITWNGFIDALLFSMLGDYSLKLKINEISNHSQIIRNCKGQFFYVPSFLIEEIGEFPWKCNPVSVISNFLSTSTNCNLLYVSQYQDELLILMSLLFQIESSKFASNIERSLYGFVFEKPFSVAYSPLSIEIKVHHLTRFWSVVEKLDTFIELCPDWQSVVKSASISMTSFEDDLTGGIPLLCKLYNDVPASRKLDRNYLCDRIDNEIKNELEDDKISAKRLIHRLLN